MTPDFAFGALLGALGMAIFIFVVCMLASEPAHKGPIRKS